MLETLKRSQKSQLSTEPIVRFSYHAVMVTSDLLPIIAEIFIRRGYDGATLAQLSRATGLSKASLYHHFPDGKAEMAASIVRSAIADLHGRAFVPLSVNRPPESLRLFVLGFASYVQDGRSDCILSIFAHQEHEDINDLNQQISAQFRDWHMLLKQAHEGHGLKTKRAGRAAHDLMAHLYGALSQAKLHNQPEIFQNTVKRLAKQYTKQEKN